MSAEEKYEEALRSCPGAGGGVHAWMLGAANLAAAAGIPAEQAAVEITGAMSRRPSPPHEVRDTVQRAYREHGGRSGLGLGIYVPPPPKPKPAPMTAQEFIRRGGEATEAELWEASPVHIGWGEDWRMDAVAMLHALFRPGELVFCGDTFGKTVRERDAWVERWMNGEPIPPLLCVNPLKADGGLTAGGKPSPRCDDAVAVFRHAVAEFDGMSLAEQIRFWVGWGLDTVSAITFSGGKSLHAVLRVDAESRADWEKNVRGRLFRRTLIPLGCDGACQNPARLSRLAGARRADRGGVVQKLLFVREALA